MFSSRLLKGRRGRVRTLFLMLLASCVINLVYLVTSAWDVRKYVKRTSHKRTGTTAPGEESSERQAGNYSARTERSDDEKKRITGQTSIANANLACSVPGVIQDGVPWPDCIGKINWMKNNWKKDECYAEYGVSDELCSILKYLSEVEHHCPLVENVEPKLQPLYLNGEAAEPRSGFQHLYNEISRVPDYSWIKSRIKSLESLWINSSKHLFTRDSPSRTRKRIHLHLGLMSMGLGKTAWSGGPLGELVQWSDLIAALFVMGHDIVITSKKQEVDSVYKDYKDSWGSSSCPPMMSRDQDQAKKVPFDIIYTDIVGVKEVKSAAGASAFATMDCRLRVVDSFGTEASFNHPRYRTAKKLPNSEYNGLDLNLQQFNTMFPHTPDNTFLGFVTEFATKNDTRPGNESKRDIALVYGKAEEFWKGKEKYISIVNEYVSEVHATVHEPENLPHFIINHGVVSAETLSELLKRTKIFVGLEFPFEGPAPLEAIQSGAVFLNPKFKDPVSSLNNDFYRKKPTRRKITSQNPYAEKFIGKPYVYTVDINDEESLRKALKEITSSPEPGSFLSHEFSVLGMLERVSTQIEKQQFCTKPPFSEPFSGKTEKLRWPPLSALKTHVAEERGSQSCNDVCETAGLVCEPSFFPLLNRAEGFERAGLKCTAVKVSADMESDYPAYDNGTCYLQNNLKLFSCAENYVNLRRLCPCRDYITSQVALCKQCGLRTGDQ